MPAMLDDPTAPPKYRVSGAQPHHTPSSPLPPEIAPRLVTLRDRTTAATLVPFTSPEQVPPALLRYLCNQLNWEIEKGDTYPMIETMSPEDFGAYWFGLFAAVMILGDIQHVVNLLTSGVDEGNWEKDCLGSFYIKPNYPGRSSHVCNAGFLTTNAARNRGVGRLMGEGYLEWAPKLGYTYSVFNLVYENNIASCRIWDSLGFKRIGRVPGAGNLKSFPDRFTDAIIYGRDLCIDTEDITSEARFEKIRYYLKTGQYPSDADRAQKSRLRSAAMHYRLEPATPSTSTNSDPNNPDPSSEEQEDKLMLNHKEVISDPSRQIAIARAVHISQHHAGINKTTATIADTYHWTRIKETASLTIRKCPRCRELSKAPVIGPDQALFGNGNAPQGYTSVSAAGRDVGGAGAGEEEDAGAGLSTANATGQTPARMKTRGQQQQLQHAQAQASGQNVLSSQPNPLIDPANATTNPTNTVPLDPQLIQQLQSASYTHTQPPQTSDHSMNMGTGMGIAEDDPSSTYAPHDRSELQEAAVLMEEGQDQVQVHDHQMSDAQDEWMAYINGRRAPRQQHRTVGVRMDGGVVMDEGI